MQLRLSHLVDLGGGIRRLSMRFFLNTLLPVFEPVCQHHPSLSATMSSVSQLVKFDWYRDGMHIPLPRLGE